MPRAKNTSKKGAMIKVAGVEDMPNLDSADVIVSATPLTDKEREARKIQKKSMLAGGFSKVGSYGAYGGGDTIGGSGGNWYSPQLSTDFLEKPQNQRERRAWYRHFYNTSELIGAAIDLHSTIPLSKIRLRKAKANNPHLAEYSYRFFSRLCDRLELLKVLGEISHEYHLFGNAFLYLEDHQPYRDLAQDAKDSLKSRGKAQSDMLLDQYKVIDKDPNYVGWKKVTILPPDQVRLVPVPFAEKPVIEYLPDPETRALISRANSGLISDTTGDNNTRPMVPESVLKNVDTNGVVPLQQDPSKGSFAVHLARKKSQYEIYGVSILERCIQTLLVKDKLRQAQTSIASRHMTPTRVVWGDKLSDFQLDDLRSQIDMSLMDPDYSIIANYQITWDEYGSNQRLLDLTSEFDRYDSDLYAGLGVTKEMMTGEATYSGSKLSLELLNIHYMQFRDMLQEFVEKKMFEPVARRKGFIEVDEYGNENVIYPKLTFTRLSIRDNDAVFEQVMQLYNKGSLPIEDVYDILGIDADAATAKLDDAMLTVKDATFNDLLRGVYQSVAQAVVDRTNILEKAASALHLTVNPPAAPEGEGGGDAGGGLGGLRFASEQPMKALMEALASDPGMVSEIVAEIAARRKK